MRIRRSIFVLLCLITVLSFCACGINNSEVKDKFSKYTPDNNVVVVLDSSEFYFADHTLNLRDLVRDERPNNGYTFWDGKLYFSTSKQNTLNDFSFLVYACDLYGNNQKLIFEKQGYKTKPWATGNGGVLYLEYYDTHVLDETARKIDSYNIFTGEYENVSTGKNASLSHYKNDKDGKYSFGVDSDILTITDSQKNIVYRIDSEMMNSSNFGEALTDLDYTFYGADVINNDQIYLIYRIKSDDNAYPYFVCEYIPYNNEIVFKSSVFVNDVESICVEIVN